MGMWINKRRKKRKKTEMLMAINQSINGDDEEAYQWRWTSMTIDIDDDKEDYQRWWRRGSERKVENLCGKKRMNWSWCKIDDAMSVFNRCKMGRHYEKNATPIVSLWRKNLFTSFMLCSYFSSLRRGKTGGNLLGKNYSDTVYHDCPLQKIR